MKLTNNLRLPDPMVRAVGNDSYTKGDADISVTELLTPPQLRALRIKHHDEIVEDVSDRIWSCSVSPPTTSSSGPVCKALPP